LEEEGRLESREADEKTKFRMVPPNCVTLKTGTKQKDLEVIQKRKQGRPWPGNGSTAIRREIMILCGWQLGTDTKSNILPLSSGQMMPTPYKIP
jgi:hypothetical protein